MTSSGESANLINSVLEEFIEETKKLIEILPDGKVSIMTFTLPDKEKILCYMIGVAYSAFAEKRQTDTVLNSEIKDQLKIEDSIINARLKDLREMHFINQIKKGEHRINYRKFGDVILDIKDQQSRAAAKGKKKK